jgi:hypothetical protein
MEVHPIHTRLPVVHCGGRHDGLKDMVGVDVLMSVEEAHAYVFLLVVPSILVPFQLQPQKLLYSVKKARHEGTGYCMMNDTLRQTAWLGTLLKHNNT